MRSKSLELIKQMKDYIEEYYLQNREFQSTINIAKAVGIARGTA